MLLMYVCKHTYGCKWFVKLVRLTTNGKSLYKRTCEVCDMIFDRFFIVQCYFEEFYFWFVCFLVYTSYNELGNLFYMYIWKPAGTTDLSLKLFASLKPTDRIHVQTSWSYIYTTILLLHNILFHTYDVRYMYMYISKYVLWITHTLHVYFFEFHLAEITRSSFLIFNE